MTRIGFVLLTVLAVGAATAQEKPKPSFHAGKEKVALEGYDLVSYHKGKEPVKGSQSHIVEYGEMQWHFASPENKAAFEAAPEKYLPQYGGNSAASMARGEKEPGSPHAWRVVDGKLYLNTSKEAHEAWSKDLPGNVQKADRYWTELSKPRVVQESGTPDGGSPPRPVPGEAPAPSGKDGDRQSRRER